MRCSPAPACCCKGGDQEGSSRNYGSGGKTHKRPRLFGSLLILVHLRSLCVEARFSHGREDLGTFPRALDEDPGSTSRNSPSKSNPCTKFRNNRFHRYSRIVKPWWKGQPRITKITKERKTFQLARKEGVEKRTMIRSKPPVSWKRSRPGGLQTKGPNDRQLLVAPKVTEYSPLQMYTSCVGIVGLWMLTGTLFYSYVNEWPIPQSFFYAVDAGMSIGFCTDVAETKLLSKAFTVVFILLGASVVGGALALFIQDVVEGVVERDRKTHQSVLRKGYEIVLDKKVFDAFDVNHDGSLSREEFQKLITASVGAFGEHRELSKEDMEHLWIKFDKIKDGAIHFAEFVGTYRRIDALIDSLHNGERPIARTPPIPTRLASFARFLANTWRTENRIYLVFVAWVMLGIAWGIFDQKWDPITSTHFAISALATGGLTGPSVNNDGILPARPSIFCGCYCLFGIPLMAITFGHFARVLVSDHVAALEEWALTRPMTATDYKIAKEYLEEKTTSEGEKPLWRRTRVNKNWKGLRLSDFIVLQLIRQGRVSVNTINILKKEFELLDADKTGCLTLEEATNWSSSDDSAGGG